MLDFAECEISACGERDFFSGLEPSLVLKVQITKLNNVTITVKDFHSPALAAANPLYNSKTKFDKTLFIIGLFDNAYSWFKTLASMKNYKLISNNCMQTTVDGLCRGTFNICHKDKIEKMKTARNKVAPNLAYNYLRKKGF